MVQSENHSASNEAFFSVPFARHAPPKRPHVDAPKAVDSAKPEVPKYELRDGLRWVVPYEHEFRTFAKGRWIGRTLLDVFTKEFVMYSPEYYKEAIADGRITVNGEIVEADTCFQNNDLILHRSVFTENPVLDRDIQVVFRMDDLIVVDKPSSVPIHPCGAYRYNSVIHLVRAQLNLKSDPLPTHRLDRLTSGLVLLATSKAEAKRITTAFESGDVRKSYLARVRGDASKVFGGDLPAGVTAEGDKLLVTGYIRCVDHRNGKYALDQTKEDSTAKHSITRFQFLKYNAELDESVVRAFPETGRTHQIRLHLLHLGLPITNDVCYGGALAESEHLPLISHQRNDHDTRISCGAMHPSGIYLHAYTYTVSGWSFETEMPPWAEL